MITCEKLRRQAAVFQCVTGLTVKAVENLLPAFERAYQRMLDQRDQQRASARQRQGGGGGKGALASRVDQVLFIRVSLRLYPVQAGQGLLFGRGQPQADEGLQRQTSVLHEALGYPPQRPARQRQAITEVLAQCAGVAFIRAGSERPIRRRQSGEGQGAYTVASSNARR